MAARGYGYTWKYISRTGDSVSGGAVTPLLATKTITANSNTFSRSGYYFTNWSVYTIDTTTSGALTAYQNNTITSMKYQKKVSSGSSITITGVADNTVYIIFAANWAPYYSVTVKSNDTNAGSVSGGNDYIKSGGSCTIAATSNNSDIYKFGSWNNSITSNPYAITNITTDLSYTAYWSYRYKITFNDNGGSGGPGNQTSNWSDNKSTTWSPTLSTTTPTKSGYYFYGWKYDGNTYLAGGPGPNMTSANRSITLTAIWVKYSYVWNYDFDGGTGGPEGGYQTNIAAPTYNVSVSYTKPTKTGYTFDYWEISVNKGSVSKTTAVGGDTVTLTGVSSDTVTATFKAHWTINQYTVTVNASTGGTVSVNGIDYSNAVEIEYKYGASWTIYAKADDNYDFSYWSKDGEVISGASDTKYTFTIPANNDTIYTANFTPYYYNYYWTYNLVDEGATGGPSNGRQLQTTSSSITVTVPNTPPTLTGYTFDGWTVSIVNGSCEPATIGKTGGSLFLHGKAKKTTTATLTAVWKINSYEVNYYQYDGTPHTDLKQTFNYKEYVKIQNYVDTNEEHPTSDYKMTFDYGDSGQGSKDVTIVKTTNYYYYQSHWKVKGGTELYSEGSTYPYNGNWANLELISVLTLDEEKTKIDYGEVTIPDGKWSGHTLISWEGTTADGTTVYFYPNEVIDLNDDTTRNSARGQYWLTNSGTVKANWEELHIVHFKIDSPSGSSSYINYKTGASNVYVIDKADVIVSSLKNPNLKIEKYDKIWSEVEAVAGENEQFLRWTIPEYSVTGDITIIATFRSTASLCELTFKPVVTDGSISESYAPGKIYDWTGTEIPKLNDEIKITVERGIDYQFSVDKSIGYDFSKWRAGTAVMNINNPTSSTCSIKIIAATGATQATVYVDFKKKYISLRVGNYYGVPKDNPYTLDTSLFPSKESMAGEVTGFFTNVDGTTKSIAFVDSVSYQIQEGATGTFTWNKSPESSDDWYWLNHWYYILSNEKNKKNLPSSSIIQGSSANPWTTKENWLIADTWILYYSSKPEGALSIITHIYPEGSATVSYNTGAIYKGSTINFIVTPIEGYEMRGVYVNDSTSVISWDTLVFSYTIPKEYKSDMDIIKFTFKFAFHVKPGFNPANNPNPTGYKWTSGDRDHYLESGTRGSGSGDYYYPGERFHKYLEITDKTKADKYKYVQSEYVTKNSYQSWVKKEIEFYPSATGTITANFRSLEGKTYTLLIKCVDQEGKDASKYVDITPSSLDGSSLKYAATYDSSGNVINPTVVVNCRVKSEYEDSYIFSHWDDTKDATSRRSITLDKDTELTAVLDEVTSFVERVDDSDINKYNIYYWPRSAEYHPPDGYNPYRGGANPLITPDIVGNCTWYAWGRTCEIAVVDLGKVHSGCLWIGNACNWFSSAFRTGGTSWEREGEVDPTVDPGREISHWNVGDILCFTGGWGHVAIVEAIDGDWLTISESGYKITSGYFFQRVKHLKFTLNEEWGSVRFQGVIHNPYAGKTKAVRVTTLAMPTEAGTASIGRSKDDINSKTMIISKGETVYFNAIVNEGHTFTGWYLNGEDSPISTSTLYSQKVGDSITIIACFDGYNPKDYVQIDAYPSPEDSGIVTGGGTYKKGDLVTLTADEEVYDEEGNLIWYFSSWSDGTTTSTYEFYATESLTLYANYAQDPESRDQGSDYGLNDLSTIYGIGQTILVKSITINSILYKYNAEFNSTSNQISPAMTLYVGDQTIDISEGKAGTSNTITFEDSQIETDKIKLVLAGDYSFEEYNSFNLIDIDIEYSIWDPDSGESTYHRYYDGTKWTEWVEEEVNNE